MVLLNCVLGHQHAVSQKSLESDAKAIEHWSHVFPDSDGIEFFCKMILLNDRQPVGFSGL